MAYTGRELIAARCAKFFKDGDFVNLGIGVPTMCINYLPEGVDLWLETETGACGTGAVAAWENAERLAADGRFGEHKMRVYMAQNAPFTLIHDSWKAHTRALAELDPDEGRRQAEVILAKVLSNRKPPYGIAGGVFDVLEASGGDTFACTNDEIMYWLLQFRNQEGYDLLPAPCAAVAALAQAVADGHVQKDELMAKGFVLKEPDLVLDPGLPAEEVIAAVNSLF